MRDNEQASPEKHAAGGQMDGQRILAHIHSSCTAYRIKVKDTLGKLKAQEYACAKSETVKAQQAIEAARLVELQRIADDSERPMTALEKTRLMHLQNMEDKQKAEAPPPEILDKTFSQLLDQTASPSNYHGLLVEDELERMTTPFVQELLTKVEELYQVNQTLLKLASRCRNEVLKDRSAAATMKIRIQNLEDQVSDEEKEIVQLREAVQERNSQLEGVRSAFHREVVQVKEEVVKNMTHKGAMIEDMEELVSRGFDLNLLAEPLGSDADGRSLDDMLQGLVAEYDRHGRWDRPTGGEGAKAKPRPKPKVSGGTGAGSLMQAARPDRPDKAAPPGLAAGEKQTLLRTVSPREDRDQHVDVSHAMGGTQTRRAPTVIERSVDHAKVMGLENERIQLNVKIAVMRHGLESWRLRARQHDKTEDER